MDRSKDNSKMYLRVLLHNRGDPGPPWAAAKMVPIPLAQSTQPYGTSTSPPPVLALLSSEQLPGSLETALFSKEDVVQVPCKHRRTNPPMTNTPPLTPAEVHEDQHFPHVSAADRVDAGVNVAHNVLVARQIPLQDRQIHTTDQ